MKHKSILFVSPGGTSIKAIKVRSVSVLIAVIIIVCGFSAYFIPSEKFRLKAAEVKQRRQLSVQNEVLHLRVASALTMLNRLRQQIKHLDAKKEEMTELKGMKSAPLFQPRLQADTAKEQDNTMSPEALLAHMMRLESRFASFAQHADSGKENPFDKIPVCKPTPEYAVTSRGFGKTIDPFTGRQSEHRGIDLAAAEGTPVTATASGTVERVEKNELWGNRVVIAHADGINTVYAHLGSVSVSRGRTVKRGEIVGTIGYSGLVTGPHVHYEIWKNGVAVNPEKFFFPALMTGK
jgi:murein DD-endopeptidase MepM/ murein hydrolase activator NlpD